MERNWFAVQAKPHRENIAAARVANLGAEVFLPMARRRQLVCGFRRLVTKPLFVGYFFAKFSPCSLLASVRCTLGVLRVVGTAPGPAPLAPEIISLLRERAGDEGVIEIEPASLQRGSRVKIDEGPFAGWIGRVERETEDQSRVSILLEILQAARVWIPRQQLTAVDEAA